MSKYNLNGWEPLYVTKRTLDVYLECQRLFGLEESRLPGTRSGEGWVNEDHFLGFALSKLMEYRERELAERRRT